MTLHFQDTLDDLTPPEETLFARIADDLYQKGYSIRPAGLSEGVATPLAIRARQLHAEQFASAGIGRGPAYLQNEFVRTNDIRWIIGEAQEERPWLAWIGRLQRYLNRHLLLGLFSFESHLAHYRPGDYYKRHLDAFRGEANRVLSVVTYLNAGWCSDDGGELVLYLDEQDREGIRVVPLLGTLVVFLSETFPHEVLAAQRDRYSVAGWFRVNGSTARRVDPPR